MQEALQSLDVVRFAIIATPYIAKESKMTKDIRAVLGRSLHNCVYIKIGIIDKNLKSDRVLLEKQSFLEYSINAFYTNYLLHPFG